MLIVPQHWTSLPVVRKWTQGGLLIDVGLFNNLQFSMCCSILETSEVLCPALLEGKSATSSSSRARTEYRSAESLSTSFDRNGLVGPQSLQSNLGLLKITHSTMGSCVYQEPQREVWREQATGSHERSLQALGESV